MRGFECALCGRVSVDEVRSTRAAVIRRALRYGLILAICTGTSKVHDRLNLLIEKGIKYLYKNVSINK